MGSSGVSGVLTTSSTESINLLNALPLGPGSYRLLNYGSVGGAGTGAFAIGTVPAQGATRARNYNLDASNATFLNLTVTGDSPIWTGSNNTAWDTTTTNNWVLASDHTTPTTFFTADSVLFDDTAANKAVTINGADIADLVPQALARLTAWIGQRPVLFAGTIRDNIRFARPEATDAEVDAMDDRAFHALSHVDQTVTASMWNAGREARSAEEIAATCRFGVARLEITAAQPPALQGALFRRRWADETAGSRPDAVAPQVP